jgi:Zn-dependent M16 (insulinase) family peptidase
MAVLDARCPSSKTGHQVFERIQTEWTFGIDPLTLLDVTTELDVIRRHDKSDPRYFENLAVAHLARNPHRLVLVVKPRPSFVKDFTASVAERLEETRQQLTEEQIAQIRAGDEEEDSEEEGDEDCVPGFNRADLMRPGTYTLPTSVDREVAVFIVPARETTTFRLFGKFPVTPADLVNFSLLFSLLGEVGAGDRSDEEFSIQEDMHSGGFSFVLSDIETPSDPSASFPLCGVIDVLCLDGGCTETLALLEDVLFRPRFDNPRAIEAALNSLLHSELTSCKEDGTYAAMHAQVGFGSVANYTEVLAGFHFVDALRTRVRAGDFAVLGVELAAFFERAFRNVSFVETVHCSSAAQASTIAPLFEALVQKLNTRGSEMKAEAVWRL